MKKRMRRLTGLLMAFAVILCMPLTAGAVTIDEAEQKADELEQQKEAAQAERDSLSEQLDGIIADMNATQEKLTSKEAEIEEAEN